MPKKFYNPAGIFSTDNAQADQDQIDAERGPLEDEFEEDGYYPEDPEEDLGDVTRIVFVCSDTENPDMWWTQKDVSEGELEAEMETAQKEHDQACKCGLPIKIAE